MLETGSAPSPAGKDIHPGNLRSGILNWEYAKENKGKFILRIEDTVNDRAVESCKQTIIDTLSAFGIIPTASCSRVPTSRSTWMLQPDW